MSPLILKNETLHLTLPPLKKAITTHRDCSLKKSQLPIMKLASVTPEILIFLPLPELHPSHFPE